MPAEQVQKLRNDMFLASEAVRLMQKQGVAFSMEQSATLER